MRGEEALVRCASIHFFFLSNARIRWEPPAKEEREKKISSTCIHMRIEILSFSLFAMVLFSGIWVALQCINFSFFSFFAARYHFFIFFFLPLTMVLSRALIARRWVGEGCYVAAG